MKEPHRQGLANRTVPESCVDDRKVIGEALTGAHAGQPSSCEIGTSGVPTLLSEAEGHTEGGVIGEPSSDPAQSKTLSMRGNSSPGNREILTSSAEDDSADRSGKGSPRNPDMHEGRKSDGGVVPTKWPNNGTTPAEVMEGRPPATGNSASAATSPTQSGTDVSSGWHRVREAARKDKRARFTNLLHHVDPERLRESFLALKREAAPGIDGMTWSQYEADLDNRLQDLHRRVHTGSYRATPVRRVYIPKADGRERPLGIASLEDKIVQGAVVRILNAVYEVDFAGFSYGFRPGRGAHDALDSLWMGLMTRKVNWVLDADIRGFFDTIDHEWLVKFVEHRIADRRLVRLIQKWLKAGTAEDGRWSETEVGTPQGAVISPLLANVYLHYAFDLWVQHWRKTRATGEMIVVRYADDFVLGFQHRHEAERFQSDLKERLEKFGLELHPTKTRLIQFGRFASERRAERGEGKPETFEFLGFTHLCASQRSNGRFLVRRKSSRKRLRAKLKEIGQTLRKQCHAGIPRQGSWLTRVLQGYYQYHAVPGNIASLEALRGGVIRHWRQALKRRSQRRRLNWERFGPWCDFWLPRPKILHPHPNERFEAKHPK